MWNKTAISDQTVLRHFLRFSDIPDDDFCTQFRIFFLQYSIFPTPYCMSVRRVDTCHFVLHYVGAWPSCCQRPNNTQFIWTAVVCLVFKAEFIFCTNLVLLKYQQSLAFTLTCWFLFSHLWWCIQLKWCAICVQLEQLDTSPVSISFM